MACKRGPLVDLGRPDPADDRHNFAKAAQMRLRGILNSHVPHRGSSFRAVSDVFIQLGRGKSCEFASHDADESKRAKFFGNCWRATGIRVPQETYYVYYIFSAAVIGENPRLFGFKFDNPLAHLER